ncbi:ABC transporter permease subunit [Actinocatenispora rupis]|uniref:ABC-type transport system involved in multi-copper enzyme maturation, permease component n=1 Tax=Actinocatenispora rupis TaxID=519421 RepID=A0A8J3J3S3_9ACTN|nr:ABC transporter permease subunit [Actinocatenispora rupis]GID15281.1 hypothetical protein Aru02nite_61700 [Actinocatenispora rupis]
MTGALSAEWLKLRSLRSTWYLVGVVALATAGGLLLSWYAAHLWDTLPAARRAHLAVAPPTPLIQPVVETCLGILGVLALAGEYGRGTLRGTLTAVPRRGTVLAAKAGTVAAVALVLGLACVTCTTLGARALVGDRHIAGLTGPAMHDTPLLLAYAGAAVTAALLGLGLGAVLRSTVGAVAALVGIVHIIPMVVWHLPDPAGRWASSLVLDALPQQLVGLDNHNSVYGAALAPPAALAALLAYALLPLAAAALLLHRRDV